MRRFETAFFLLPAIIVLLVVLIYPMIYSMYISFLKVILYSNETPFIGLENFASILSNQRFQMTIFNTLKYSLVSIVGSIVLGFMAALLLREIRWGKGFFRVVLIIPMAAAPLVIGLTWRWMLDPLFGLINWGFGILGFPGQTWLAQPGTAFLSLAFIDIWEWYPLVFLITYAGLSGLPPEPYEAAAIEGASYWMTLRRITLPMLKPVILVVLLLRTVDAFRTFDLVNMVTNGGPNFTTEVMSMYLYRTAFKFSQLGHAAAGALIMLWIVSIISMFLFRYLYQEIEA